MLVSLLAVVATAAPGAPPPPVDDPQAVKRVHHAVKVVRAYQRVLAYPPIAYGRKAERRTCTAGCEWHLASKWHHRAVAWKALRARMAHPSLSSCWALLGRVFDPLGQGGTARMIVTRESHCYWAARNPSSSAAGVFQFLDSWGSLSQRLDAVWSIRRAERYWRVEGNWHPWGF